MASSILSRAGETPDETVKAPVVAATTANITLSGEQTVNGIAVVSGDRVLVKDQTAGAENGPYVVSTGAWTRASDWNSNEDVVNGMLVLDASSSILYIATYTGTFSLDSTVVTLEEFNPAPTSPLALTDVAPSVQLFESDTVDENIQIGLSAGTFRIENLSDAGAPGTDILSHDVSTGITVLDGTGTGALNLSGGGGVSISGTSTGQVTLTSNSVLHSQNGTNPYFAISKTTTPRFLIDEVASGGKLEMQLVSDVFTIGRATSLTSGPVHNFVSVALSELDGSITLDPEGAGSVTVNGNFVVNGTFQTTGAWDIPDNTNLNFGAGNDMILQHSTSSGNIIILNNGFNLSVLNGSAGNATTTLITDDGNIEIAGTLQSVGIELEEVADHPVTPATGIGQIWYRNSDKAVLFTDADGTDVNMRPASTTWTPTWEGASGSTTYVTQTGTYTRMGDRVFFEGRLVLSTTGTLAGAVNIGMGALPTVINDGILLPVQITPNDFNRGTEPMYAYINPATGEIFVGYSTALGEIDALVVGDIGPNSDFNFSGMYRTSDAV